MRFISKTSNVHSQNFWVDTTYIDPISGALTPSASYKGITASRVKPNFKFSNQVLGQTLILRDLENIQKWLQIIDTKTKKFSELHITKVEVEEDKYLVDALWRSSIITYMKCFTRSEGRFAGLDKKIIKTKSHIDFHEEIEAIRNNFIAHSYLKAQLERGEINEFHATELNGNVEKIISIQTYQNQFQRDDLTKFKELLSFILNYTVNKLGKTLEKL